MTQEPKITAALIYDFDGTLAPGNMQEYDFIPAVGQSNREFWNCLLYTSPSPRDRG